MEVIKRDGRVVEYDRNKILVAIRKANDEVRMKEKISEGKIEGIVRAIESLNKPTMQVEEIQQFLKI